MAKHIFVTGGVVSSLGKGLTSASIALLLENRGLNVAIQKLDPYINVDPGTMSPFQHGEVYVTQDGAETDLDLGHYERFTKAVIDADSNHTTGQIYHHVISKERRGDYLGKTVQVIPHITDEIKSAILGAAKPGIDIVITELGGTVGDIESLPFLEAIRQFGHQHRKDTLYIHLTLLPYLSAAGELKTKPTQHSVARLREIGIQPDVICCRTEVPMNEEIRDKISLFCNVPPEAVIEEMNVEYSIYEVPIMLRDHGLDQIILDELNISAGPGDLTEWLNMLKVVRNPKYETTIAVVGKYTDLTDAYKSIFEALTHGGIANNARVKFKTVASGDIEKDGAEAHLGDVDGILVPGGFGERGVEGKILATGYARTSGIPFFGICLGMQCATIEFARNECGLEGAHSTEFEPDTPYPVIHLLDEQKDVEEKGGTMRLGQFPCMIKTDTKTFDAYQEETVDERHRHRFEFNNAFREEFASRGMVLSGLSPDRSLVEILEVKDHPWFIATQFHPEFQSKPIKAHPLFEAFIAASIGTETTTSNTGPGTAKKVEVGAIEGGP